MEDSSNGGICGYCRRQARRVVANDDGDDRDLDDDPELYAGHVLDEVPLVFEDGGAIATADERQRCGRMRSGRPGGDQSRTTAVRRGPRNVRELSASRPP